MPRVLQIDYIGGPHPVDARTAIAGEQLEAVRVVLPHLMAADTAIRQLRAIIRELDTPRREAVEAAGRAQLAAATCPECGDGLRVREGPYKAFLGCRSYPRCTYSRPLPAAAPPPAPRDHAATARALEALRGAAESVEQLEPLVWPKDAEQPPAAPPSSAPGVHRRRPMDGSG